MAIPISHSVINIYNWPLASVELSQVLLFEDLQLILFTSFYVSCSALFIFCPAFHLASDTKLIFLYVKMVKLLWNIFNRCSLQSNTFLAYITCYTPTE